MTEHKFYGTVFYVRSVPFSPDLFTPTLFSINHTKKCTALANRKNVHRLAPTS